MKKTLIALAALASIGSAFAQTAPTVTVYGKVDLGLVGNTSNAAGAVDQGLTVQSSAYEGSRFGLKGDAGIGGGMKVVYQIEAGVNASTGATNATLFNRVAKAGITGSFGTVLAGRDWSPYDNAFVDALEYNGFSAMNVAWGNGAHFDGGLTGSGNVPSSLQYITPDMGGFNATIMYAPGGDKTATTSASSYTGLGLNYSKGPVAVSFAYENKSGYQNSTLLPGNTTNAWILTGSYDLGVAKVFGGFQQADVSVLGKDVGYEIGVSVPMGKATVAAGYATETNQVAGMTDGKSNAFGVQVVYAMTPAFALYGGVVNGDNTAAAAGAQTKVTTNKYAVGFRYNF